MSPAAFTRQNVGTAPVTEPGPDHDWKITLLGKVIAITGANRGIGLCLAIVSLANEAAEAYSLDLFEPGEEF
ncbi:hypothetical protein CC80DRAFT_551827 [Byssothecium circinans]|uniref:Uncharacterized protein n=1 Tax=Byssothecium circinans TaxID=147558 RepID=A0A6A5TLP9_9PLEO|nr:hypothetical protein CC80DRAFT_551827 [Byssothecium circinans]